VLKFAEAVIWKKKCSLRKFWVMDALTVKVDLFLKAVDSLLDHLPFEALSDLAKVRFDVEVAWLAVETQLDAVGVEFIDLDWFGQLYLEGATIG
jgi:hypothetical protein